MAPPKNRRNQSKTATGANDLKKQMGAEQQKHSKANTIQTLIGFSAVYPPRDAVIFPPIMTPKIGPVTLITAYEILTTTLSSLRYVSK